MWNNIDEAGLPPENGLYLFRNEEGVYIVAQVFQKPTPHWVHACNRYPAYHNHAPYQTGFCQMTHWMKIPR